jgi:hypothetical protein
MIMEVELLASTSNVPERGGVEWTSIEPSAWRRHPKWLGFLDMARWIAA